MVASASKYLSAPFGLEPLTPTIGVTIEGANLTLPTPTLCQALWAALLRWKVLFFYDNNLTTGQLIEFGRQFGKLEVNPVLPHKPGYPEVIEFVYNDNDKARENVWHSDVTWRSEPSLCGILRAIEVPETGGDTLFADMCAAYEGLPRAIKNAIEGCKALHSFGYLRVGMRNGGMSQEEIAALDLKYPPVEHPIVRMLPETERKALFVNAAFTRHIVGKSTAESTALLKYLYAQATIPEYQCRFRWRKDAIAFWDNRACQHYAVSDYWPANRHMERVSIVGDRPY